MPENLPPDLARLGDELVVAARRTASAQRRRRRRRLAVAGAAAAIAFAALTPAGLDPSQRDLATLAAAEPVCVHAGASGAPAMCERAMVLNRPVAWR